MKEHNGLLSFLIVCSICHAFTQTHTIYINTAYICSTYIKPLTCTHPSPFDTYCTLLHKHMHRWRDYVLICVNGLYVIQQRINFDSLNTFNLLLLSLSDCWCLSIYLTLFLTHSPYVSVVPVAQVGF